MNSEHAKGLLDECKRSPVWRELRYPQYEELSIDQLAFVVFAELVASWTLELERIKEGIERDRAEDYQPQSELPERARLAYYDGRYAAIDIASTVLASICARERDGVPGWQAFMRLFEEVGARLYKLTHETEVAA